MRPHLVVFIAASVAFFATALPRAQMAPWNNAGLSGPPSGPSGPAPRRDLSGTWDAGFAGVQPTGHTAAPFTPLGQKMASANKPGNGTRLVQVTDDNDPLSTMGDPTGFPRIILYELRPFQIVQTPANVLFAYEFASASRIVYMNSSEESPAESWMGFSRGRWDGDTLVVDVAGFNEDTWFDRAGNFHSTDLHVVERYTRTGPDVLQYEATLEDPKVFTRPWTIRMPLYRRLEKNAQLLEYKCVEFVEELMYGHLRKKAGT